MALHTDLEKAKSTMDLSSLVEKEGIAYTVLRPSGKIKIGQEIYDGISESGFIEKEELVKVIRTENAQIYVIKLS
jgi:membrane-bound serine protease (ClpP class)